jgi:hypothetical protein
MTLSLVDMTSRSSSIKYVGKKVLCDLNGPLEIGWYFLGEDFASMYGPYKTKELCENALIRYVDDLNKNVE